MESGPLHHRAKPHQHDISHRRHDDEAGTGKGWLNLQTFGNDRLQLHTGDQGQYRDAKRPVDTGAVFLFGHQDPIFRSASAPRNPEINPNPTNPTESKYSGAGLP